MGFFSADCTGCGHPLLSTYAANDINAWMINGVTILANGSILKGAYDGYGRYERGHAAEPLDGAVDGTVWHQACWAIAGSPTDYRGESQPSEDQGYFFVEEHDMPEPTLPEPTLPEPTLPEQHGTSGSPPVAAGEGDRGYRVDVLREVLGYLIARDPDGTPQCERSTSGVGACFAPGTDRTADARYGEDRACPSCIAHAALAGREVPLGPGPHADE